MVSPTLPGATLVRGQKVGIWALPSWNAVLGVRRVFLTLFHSPAPGLTPLFMMQTMSAWGAGLGPLSRCHANLCDVPRATASTS